MTGSGLDHKNQVIFGEMLREDCDRGTLLHFKVISGSMRPLIDIGDSITVGSVEPGTVRIGDVVAFREGESIVIHRVIGRSGPKNAPLIFRHRGDNGAVSGSFEASALIGRVLAVAKKGRETWLDTPRHVIINIILGWRLRFRDGLDRMKWMPFSAAASLVLRPAWRLCRRLLLNAARV